MSALHIYTAGWQPATRYKVPGLAHVFRSGPRRLWRTDCCRKLRYACNVELQVYYDLTRRRCVAGKGCKRGTP